MSKLPVYCGKCLKKYSRKENWEDHFNHEKIRKLTGGYGENICFDPQKKDTVKVFDVSLEKAKKKYEFAIKSSRFFKLKDEPPAKKPKLEEQGACCSSSIVNEEHIDKSLISDGINDFIDDSIEPLNNDSVKPPNIDTVKPLNNDSVKPLNNDSVKLLDNDSVKPIDYESVQHLDDKNPDVDSVKPTDTSNVQHFQEKLDQVFGLLQSVSQRQIDQHKDILNEVKCIESSSNVQAKGKSINHNFTSESTLTADEHFAHAMTSLKYAESVEEILNNSLIKDSFKLVCTPSENVANVGDKVAPDIELEKVSGEKTQNPGEKYVLYCLGCCDQSLRAQQGKHGSRLSRFRLQDPTYSKKSVGKKIPKWFSNLKLKLREHCRHIAHHQLTTSYNLLNTKRFQNASMIKRLRLNIIYFLLRSNSSFSLYPILLAVLSRCGNEIGNYNSSRYIMPKVLDLLGKKYSVNVVVSA